MGWIESEALGLFGPGLTDVFVGGEAEEGLETTGEVVGDDEVGEMASQLFMGLVVVALHSRFLERPVHSFDLAVGPGMVRLGEPMFDAVLSASAIERMAAAAIVVMLPVIALTIVIQREIVQGLSAGGVK